MWRARARAGEAGLQRIGRLVKNFGERFEREVARSNSIFTAEDFFKDGGERGLSFGNCGEF